MPFFKESIYVWVRMSCLITNYLERKELGHGYAGVKTPYKGKRASVSASLSQTLTASVTVEAVICLPLVIYVSVCLIWLLELRALQLTVRCALQEAGKCMAAELSEVPILIPNRLEEEIRTIIGEERLERSLIADGVHCEKSYIWGNTGIMELTAEYEVKLPFPEFAVPNMVYQEQMRMKVWNGYVKGGKLDPGIETVVYVTETGVVYHKDYKCNYLDLSVRSVNKDVIDELRNKDGGKYHACELCGSSGRENVYITDYGNRYHSSLNCSGMKRKIYAVPLSEVKGKGACSKCGD